MPSRHGTRDGTRAMRLRLASLLSAVVAAGAAAVADTEAADLAAENSMLQLKLKRLEDELQQELKYAPVLSCRPEASTYYPRHRAAVPSHRGEGRDWPRGKGMTAAGVPHVP